MQWGDDWDHGIDNISLTVSAVPTLATPEPASTALVVAGRVALGIGARKGARSRESV